MLPRTQLPEDSSPTVSNADDMLHSFDGCDFYRTAVLVSVWSDANEVRDFILSSALRRVVTQADDVPCFCGFPECCQIISRLL
jgi:hypothetical protein